MLKELFIKIQTNQKGYSSDELKQIEKFLKDEIIVKIDDNYELNSKYKVAIVNVGKNLVILEDLISEHKNIKIEFDDLNGAYDGDLVLAKRVFNPRSRTKAKIIKILDGKKNDVLVYIKDKAFHTVKENIKLENKNALKYKEGEVLLVDNKSLELIKNLGNIEDPKIDEYISLYLYKEIFRLDKPLEIDAKMDDTKQRVDLRDLAFCTIDPSSAKDHDDAIYYDKLENILYVAIADVSYFVKEGSELDKLAYLKSTSIYLPHKVLPMLPPILSEEMCSLKEGIDRYSYVFKIYLDVKNLVGFNKKHDQHYWTKLEKSTNGKDYILGLNHKLCIHVGSIAGSVCNVLTKNKNLKQRNPEELIKFEDAENKLDSMNFDEFYKMIINNKEMINNW